MREPYAGGVPATVRRTAARRYTDYGGDCHLETTA